MATPIIPALGTIPQGIAPAPQPQNQADLQAKVLNLKALQQQLGNGQLQQQSEQQRIQLQQMELDDRNGLHRAMIDSGGDPDKLRANILDPKYGVSPNGQFSTIKSLNDYKTSQLQLGEADRKNNIDSDAALADRYQKIQELPEGEQDAAVSALKSDANFLQSLTPRGQQEIANFQYAGPDSVKLMAHSHMTRAALDDQAGKELDQQNKALALKAKTDWLAANPGKTEADYNIAQEEAKATAEETGRLTAQQKVAKPGQAVGTSLEVQEANDWLAHNPGKTLSDYQKYEKSITPTATFNLQQGALKDNALDMAAENYFATGQLPSGMRSPAMSASIISRAAQLHPNATGDLAGNRAAYEANKKSYDNVTGTLDTLQAFENSAGKNLDQFLSLVDKLPDTGIPWLNTPVRLLNDRLVGNQWAPAVNAAREVGLREIARVTNDPKLSGALTDSARQEVQNFSPTNATLPQIKNVLQVLRNDMSNVEGSLVQQKKDIGGRLGIKADSAQAGGTEPKTVGGHVIKIGDKYYSYNGTGDTADLKNYKETQKPK